MTATTAYLILALIIGSLTFLFALVITEIIDHRRKMKKLLDIIDKQEKLLKTRIQLGSYIYEMDKKDKIQKEINQPKD